MNLNLPTDLQRLAPLLAVAVLAVVGLFLVTRGLGGEETTVPSNPAPAKSSPAKPADADKSNPPKEGSANTNPSGGSETAKPSNESYVNCVEQANDPRHSRSARHSSRSAQLRAYRLDVEVPLVEVRDPLEVLGCEVGRIRRRRPRLELLGARHRWKDGRDRRLCEHEPQ